jgi:membrane-associated phospholipid phosphatase
MPLVVMMVAFRHCRWLGYVLLPFVAATVVSTLYLQMHYLIDVVAGIALVPVCLWIGVRGDTWWLRVTTALRGQRAGRERSPAATRVLQILQVVVVVVAAVWVTWRLV